LVLWVNPFIFFILFLWVKPFFIFYILQYAVKLITVSYSRHARHYTENVVVGSIDTDLSSGSTTDSGAGKDKLKGSIVDSGEVTAARRLVLLRAKGEGVHVDTGIGGTCVVLERLDDVEVCTLTLRETVLAVKLKLGSDDRVLTPAMHIESGLGKDECTGIRDEGTLIDTGTVRASGRSESSGVVDTSSIGTSRSSGILEETGTGDEGIRTRGLIGSTESVNGVGKSINGISVVERLGAKGLVKSLTALEGSTVIYVSIRLDDPDKLLTGMVEIELDLVGRGTDRLVTCELKLLDEVLMGVLGHLSTLVSVKEDIVDVKRSGNKGLLVSSRNGLRTGSAVKGLDSPQALTNRTEINVDLDLVVLKGNQRKSKSGVAAKPEKKGNVKGGLRKGLARGTDLGRSTGSGTRSTDISERRIGDVGKLGGVTNHLEVTAKLIGRHGKLVPDVHPVTVLTVNALTSNLNLNLSDELLSGEI
jgi:hypothetical protein